MNFKKVLKLIIKDFEESSVSYSLMGGFALGIYEVFRATIDMDFLVDVKDLDKVKQIMKKYMYKTIYETENVIQFDSDIKEMGSIDFILSKRNISNKMLLDSDEYEILNNEIKIKVLKIEDLVAFKLQAINNDITRKKKDWNDIVQIIEKNNSKIKWNKLKEYFELFDMLKEFIYLKNKYYE